MLTNTTSGVICVDPSNPYMVCGCYIGTDTATLYLGAKIIFTRIA
jgi:hypothetical protein